MTELEKYSWGSLITTGVIWFYFMSEMLTGWQVRDFPDGALVNIYISLIIAFIVLEIIMAIVLTAIHKGKWQHGGHIRDERDQHIARKATRNANWFVVVAVNMIIFVILFDSQYTAWFPIALEPLTKSAMFFVLMSTLILSTLVEKISAISYNHLHEG